MNSDYNRYETPHEPPPYRAPRGGGGIFLGFFLGLGVVCFGAVCVVAGIYVMKYASRLDALESAALAIRNDDAPERRDHFASYAPRREPAPRPETSAASTTSNNAQPQIYFMMGGQGNYGGMPSMPAFYNPQMPQMPPFMQPDMATELNQFIMSKYQNEFAEYIRQRTMQAPAVTTNAQQTWLMQGPGFAPVAMKRDYISTAVAVPPKMTHELKRRFSRDAVVEDWLKEETAAPAVAAGDSDSPNPDVDLQLDDVLRSLAETTFADQQFDRTARVYAELASRSVNLSVVELMRWAKAAELSGDPDSALRILDLVLKIDAGNVEAVREAANVAVASKKFSQAAEYYSRLMQVEPAQREWRMMRAKTLTWSGRGREAVELMRQLHIEEPSDWELNLMLADLLLSLHEYEEALPLLDALIAHSPDDDSLLDRKMNSLMALQRFTEAAEITTILLDRHPGDADLLLKQAVNLVAAGEYSASIAPFEQYLTAKPEDLDVRQQYAEALMASQNFSAAARQYRIIIGREDFEDEGSEYQKKLANALLAARDFSGAAVEYGQLAALYPEDSEINFGLATSLRMSGQIREALMVAQNYLSFDPFDARMLTLAGEMAIEVKDIKRATDWFRTSLKLNPDDYKTRMALANALMWNQDYEQSESEFRRVLLYAPDDEEARRGLARALFFLREYGESFKVFRELAWEDASGVIATELKFREAVANGQEVEAAKHLQVLQELEPQDITWKSDRYQGLLRQRRFPEARAQARVVLEQDPSHQPTIKGMLNMRDYLVDSPVTLRLGLLRKSSKRSENSSQDRQAKLTYTYLGLHAERSFSDFWRLYADADREKWNMREAGVSDLNSYRFKLGGIFMGHPNLRFQGDLGYRWYVGSDQGIRGTHAPVDDQWLYNLRAEMVEIGGRPLNLGIFSGRREHYDNYRNAYDDLYAYDFGVDAHYRWRKWNFNAELVSSVLTDSNTRLYFHGDAKYRLYESECMLITVGGNVEYENWVDYSPTYYSPGDVYKYGVDIDGRYYFCRNPEVWGATSSYIDFGLSIYRDRFSSTGQKFYLGINHDYSQRLTAFARLDFNRESYYNEVKLLAGLTYKFGGCE